MNKLLLLFLLISQYLFSQQPGSVDLNFAHSRLYAYGDSLRFFGSPYDFVFDTTGNIIVAGDMSVYNGKACERIVRLSYDGTMDSTFAIGAAFDSAIAKVIIQNDGKLVVCGRFRTCFSHPMNGIARLNSDGSFDPTFQTTGTGFINPDFRTLTRDNYGNYLVGGDFNGYNGAAIKDLIRFTSTGSLDLTFNTGTGVDGIINSIAVQADDKIIAGGYIAYYNSDSAHNIIRLFNDGSRDTSFDHGTGFNNDVRKIIIQPDSQILCAGFFQAYDHDTTPQLSRLNTDGTIDTSFHHSYPAFRGFVYGIDSGIHEMTLLSNGNIVVTGDFVGYGNDSLMRIAMFRTDGSLDSTFISRNGFGRNNVDLNSGVVREDQGGNLLVLTPGDATYGNIKRNQLVRINSDGSLNSNYFNVETGFTLIAASKIIMQPDGKFIAGGSFERYDGYSSHGIVRINSDGSVDTTFFVGTGINTLIYSKVNDVIIQPDGKIIIAGGFYTFNNYSSNGIVRLFPNGRVDTTFHVGTGFNSSSHFEVKSLVIQPDGKIIAAGIFDTYNGQPVNNIIRIDSTGLLDPSFNIGIGPDNFVSAMALQSNGQLVIGGNFQSFNSFVQRGIVRLNTDGSTDQTFQFEAYGNVNKILIAGSKILIGGNFFGTIGQHLVRLNMDGSPDSAFINNSLIDGVNHEVFDIAVSQNNKIIAIGDFLTYSSAMSPTIVRINNDGTMDTSFQSGGGFYSQVPLSLVIQPDDKIVIAGVFNWYISIYYANGIIRLNGDQVLTGIETENRLDYVNMYPNPAHDKLKIKFPEPNNRLIIYNSMGVVVFDKMVFEIETELNIDFLPGIYFISVSNSKKRISGKLVVE